MNLLDTIDEIVLGHVNKIDDMLKSAEENINSIKAELGRAGFEVKFEKNENEEGDEEVICYVFRKEDAEKVRGFPEIVSKGDFVEFKDVRISNYYVAREKAVLADGDYYVELLGRYLSLARAARIVLGSYS